MKSILGLQVGAIFALLVLSVLARLVLKQSRQRTALIQLSLVAAAHALVANLFWQGAPLLAAMQLLLMVLLAWGSLRLVIAVRQLELARRQLSRIATLLMLGLAPILFWRNPELLSLESGLPAWQQVWPLRIAVGLLLALFAVGLLELLIGMLSGHGQSQIWPWLGVQLLLIAAVATDLGAASAVAQPLGLQPWGSVILVPAVLLALVLSWRHSGPFPLQGELPRAAFVHSHDPVLLVDGAQRVQALTASALDLLEIREGQALGQPLQKILPPAASAGQIWEGPIWLEDHSRPDGGLWLHSSQMESGDGIVARLIFLRAGNTGPPEGVDSRPTARQDLIQGPAVWPSLRRVIRRYGHGRQALAASLHVDYDWARVQAQHGDAVVQGLVNEIGERLLGICDWSVDCYRLGSGQYLLLLSDLTSPEEMDDLLHRAQSALSQPFVLARKRWELSLRMAVVKDLRLYRHVDEWLQDAAQALRRSRGTIVPTQAAAQHRNRVHLALEQAVSLGGIDWCYQPVVNLTTQQLTAWRVIPRWTPEPEVDWQGEVLRDAVAGLHLQRHFYALHASLAERWELPLWLSVPLADLAAAQKGLGSLAKKFVLELDQLSAEMLRQQGLRAVSGGQPYLLPVASGRGFSDPLGASILRLDQELVLPGLADDQARQALIKGCRGAARVRKQRLYAPGVRNRVDLACLRELGVDYASGPVIGAVQNADEARLYEFRPGRL